MLGAIIEGLTEFMHVIFVLLTYSKQIWVLAVLQMLSNITLDYLLLSQLPGSLRMGVLAVAFSNIGSYIVVLVYAVVAFWCAFGWSREEFFAPLSWTWLRSWWRVGRWAAVVAFVRNLCYIVFIARMMN